MPKYPYGLDFQRRLAAAMIRDKEFMRSHGSILQPESFSDELLRAIVQSALLFYREHGVTPSYEAIIEEGKKLIPPGRNLAEVEEEAKLLFECDLLDSSYYQQKAMDFAKSQALSLAIAESTTLLRAGDVGEASKVISAALKAGQSLGPSPYNYLEGIKGRVKNYLAKETGREGVIETGFPVLTDSMRGGLSQGEMGVIVALPKAGKTTLLVNLAANALLLGKTVAYFTFELSRTMIATKIDSKVTGRSDKEIMNNPKVFAKEFGKALDKSKGKLYIFEFPTKSMPVDRLTNILEQYPADLVLVDYGQLLRAPVLRDERHLELTDIYEGLRRAAGEIRIPVWVAHQANRTGAGSRIIKPEHIAGDFNVLAIADIALSINYTVEEQRAGKLRMYLMGSRIGPSGFEIDCQVDWSKSTIQETNDVLEGKKK